ncbi:MAG: DUF4160 domain-containing protein [Gallionella sp.]|nr:DUF4160 domain-containing protein [Gallionella sp.]
MPTISMFYGILILMFYRDNRRHHLPHIHARYQGSEAAISIDDGSIFEGSLPPKQLKGTSKNSSHRRRPVSSLLKILDSGLRRNDEI